MKESILETLNEKNNELVDLVPNKVSKWFSIQKNKFNL